MSALVEYASSDEEDALESKSQPPKPQGAHETVEKTQLSTNGNNTEPSTNGYSGLQNPRPEHDDPLVGPALGPSETERAAVPSPSPSVDAELSTPQSPYSANRTRLRQLTLPPIPKLDMPDSPPGSPPRGTSAKFAHFLDLKKQGVHFNEKLAKSSALKNPSMMQKLMDFANISDMGQYATTLPKDIWDPNGFPEWAFKEELGKSQQTILKKKEDEKAKGQRNSLDFVPATASGDSSRNGTPGSNAGGRGGHKSAAERVMAGLDRGKVTSPAVQAGTKRKTRFEN